ncbi:MAG: helix-turn-helix transcriptional regulator [Bacteroidales bacterium]|nr:helix-turn-helix transcriptional regulator [Bacteroidales bacterium]
MKTHFDIEELIKSSSITNELDYERALIADRKLRLLAKDNDYFKKQRKKLRDLIEAYEKIEWNNVDNIDENKLVESEKSEYIADLERDFLGKRKQIIRQKLKKLDLTQENLATFLGHKSKTHMSELMNGIKPFTLKDLIIISRLLKIDIKLLIPVFLSKEDQKNIQQVIANLDKPKVKLSKKDLVFA